MMNSSPPRLFGISARLLVVALPLVVSCGPQSRPAPAQPAVGADSPGPAEISAQPPGEQTIEDCAPEEDLCRKGLVVLPVSRSCVPPANLAANTLIAVSVCAQLSGTAQWVGVRDGAVLHPGDAVAIHLRLGRPAYVHVVQLQNDEATTLWPISGAAAQRLQPGVAHQIPSEDFLMRLDSRTGLIRMFVIASERPVRDVDEDLWNLIEGFAARPTAVRQEQIAQRKRESTHQRRWRQSRPQGREQPSAPVARTDSRTMTPAGCRPEAVPGGMCRGGLGEKGIVLEHKDQAHLEASSNDAGIALLEFQIDHRPPP
jgi:hypothetical protein